MSPVHRLLDPTFRSAWHRLVRLWRPLAAWTFLTWIVAGICVTPLLSAGLSRLVLRGDRILIGNEELLAWLLTPEGLVYLALAGTIFLLGTVIRYAGMFRIVTDDLYGANACLRQTLLSLILQAPALFRLCLVAVVAALGVLAPLVAGLGAIYAEIDIQRTRDGEIVVIHDADLMRVAGDPQRVANADFADLADLTQGGETDHPPELLRLATLEEFLEHARGRIRLQIEFKHYGWDPQLIPQTIELIREKEMQDEIVLMSLNLRAVREAKQLAPEIPVGFVASLSVGNPRRMPVDFLAVSRNLATPRLIRDAHARDMEVHIWTLNRADTILDAIQRGADGVITDDPALAVRIREELAELNALERILLLFRDLMPEAELAATTDEESGDIN